MQVGYVFKNDKNLYGGGSTHYKKTSKEPDCSFMWRHFYFWKTAQPAENTCSGGGKAGLQAVFFRMVKEFVFSVTLLSFKRLLWKYYILILGPQSITKVKWLGTWTRTLWNQWKFRNGSWPWTGQGVWHWVRTHMQAQRSILLASLLKNHVFNVSNIWISVCRCCNARRN